MIIKRDSWHCKMVTYLLDSPKRDLCGYIRQVLWLLMVFIALAVCLLLWFGSTGVSIFTALGISSAGFMLLPATLTGLMAIVLILGLIASPIYCIWYLYEKRRSRKEAEEYEARANGTYVKPEPGFIKSAYKSFKDKTCHFIEFK
ncbi:hypothetical protein CPTPhageEI1_094 [Klebsiella phage EI]|nr:hypothetical protein CPTPhageEI1_094 [Klebsiella phage EI]